ncbi:MAG: hypothetical protein A2W85_04860 [Bacteroidetes bacterium GWF2_41_31]|nr:MAG: hypothetical protein A2W85_04860 [Bacteroidetes bacterium GWF2_41_31]
MLKDYRNVQVLFIAEDEEKFRRFVYKDDDLFLTSLTRYYDAYAAIKTFGLNWTHFACVTLWHPEQVKDLGKDGHFIIGMIKMGTLWTLYLAKNTGITDQEISVFERWEELKKHIHSQWKKGFDITDLYENEGKYYIVTSKGLNWKQSYYVDLFPEEVMEEKAKEGKFITEIMHLGERNLWVFSGNTGYRQQLIRSVSSNEELTILREALLSDEGFEGGYRASLLRSLGGTLFVVLLK